MKSLLRFLIHVTLLVGVTSLVHAITITFEGTCSFSGSSNAIAVDDAVTITLTLNGDAVDGTTTADAANFQGFSQYNFALEVEGSNAGSFSDTANGTLDLMPHLGTTIVNAFMQDSSGGIPGLTDGEYGGLVFISVEVNDAINSDSGGSVALSDVLPNGTTSASASGGITIEPDWDSRVEIAVTKVTVVNDGGTNPGPTPNPLLPAPINLAQALGNDWHYLYWYGVFYYIPAYGNWTYTGDLNWMYVDPTGSPDSLWIWSEVFQDWMWANQYNDRWLFASTWNYWVYIYSNNPDWGCWIYYENWGQWQYFTF